MSGTWIYKLHNRNGPIHSLQLLINQDFKADLNRFCLLFLRHLYSLLFFSMRLSLLNYDSSLTPSDRLLDDIPTSPPLRNHSRISTGIFLNNISAALHVFTSQTLIRYIVDSFKSIDSSCFESL